MDDDGSSSWLTGASPTIACDAARVDAVWGDPAAWTEAGHGWTSLPAVHRMLNRRVSGDPSKRPLDWFFRKVAAERALPLDRCLILACGGGDLDRWVLHQGYVREIVAVDLSERALAVARSAAEREGLSGIDYRRGDMNDLRIDDGPFDVVLAVSAAHHCAALEGLFATLSRLVKPDGWLFLDDFVGPSRFQWSDAQLEHTNRLLALLPERLIRTPPGHVRRRCDRAAVADIVAFDPSEAVRSAEIPTEVARHFDVVERRGYGGALLHLALAHVAQNFEAGDGPLYLDRLIAAEERLTMAGRLSDDFMAMIARPRRPDRS